MLQIACGKRWRMIKEKEGSRRSHRSHRSHTSQEPKAKSHRARIEKKKKSIPPEKKREKLAFPLQVCAGLRSQYASFVGQHAVVRELSSSTSYWVCFYARVRLDEWWMTMFALKHVQSYVEQHPIGVCLYANNQHCVEDNIKRNPLFAW